MEFWARKTHVNDLRQSRRHVSGRAAQSRAALRATLYALVNVRRVPTLSPREERVGRGPERGAFYFCELPASSPQPSPPLRRGEGAAPGNSLPPTVPSRSGQTPGVLRQSRRVSYWTKLASSLISTVALAEIFHDPIGTRRDVAAD